jgi:uncharacterized protein
MTRPVWLIPTLLLLLSAATPARADSAPLADTSASPHVKLTGVGLGEARWTTGFWADRLATAREHTIPAMFRLMDGTEHSQFLENFRVAAGDVPGRHRGPKWNDGDFYKWLEAAAALYAVDRAPDLDRRIDQVIALIARAQRPDGYLHTPVLISQRNGGDAKPFGDPQDFEVYNMGHLMTAACVHHRATGKTTLLAVARKAADFLCEAFKSPDAKLAGHGICPAHYMGLVEMYRTTRQPRYLELARKLIDMRDQVVGGTDDNQDRLPFRQQTKAVGHAVRANYLYAGVADVYAETGDATLLAPLEKIWTDLVTRKLYLTGGCGALYDGASPDGSKEQKQITRVHQAYGRDYQLPNATAHNETCAAIGNVLWNWRMLQVTGDAKYADVIEQAMYNAIPAGVGLDGTSFFYTNTLRQLDPMPVELRWSRQRQPWISCFCCPPNVARTIAESASYAYAKSDRGIYVTLYGTGTCRTTLKDGTPLSITQETDYPWDGSIHLTVALAEPKEFTIVLRIPGWSRDTAVRVNGRHIPEAVTPGTFREIRRTWTDGDTVELDLPMPPRLVEANPLVEETRNQVAVVRGPIVYCLESPDLPAGVRVQDVRIPRDVKWTTRRNPSTLGGVTLVEGPALASPMSADWNGQLYRDVPPASADRPIDLKLIPYFAWANRGKSEMSVWLPAGR